ncbi:MAG: hypothetical protein KGK08_05675 [Acidobacteriota bacterium]|nr:hypothetical protein [Acidobacteriota bacterium]
MTRRERRETNANRQARIARTIQETYTARYELFGGGGFLRFRPGEYLQRNPEITWATSGTYFLSEKLGISADIRGGYGNAKVGNTIYNIPNPLITEYTFMGGATYRVRTRLKYAVSVNALAGYSLGNFDGGSKGISATKLGMWATSNKPVFSVGASFDYNLYPNLALRVTPTYVGTMFRGVDLNTGASNGTIQNNLGFNAGIVYRFGKIK